MGGGGREEGRGVVSTGPNRARLSSGAGLKLSSPSGYIYHIYTYIYVYFMYIHIYFMYIYIARQWINDNASVSVY